MIYYSFFLINMQNVTSNKSYKTQIYYDKKTLPNKLQSVIEAKGAGK